jgi:cytochrome P450
MSYGPFLGGKRVCLGKTFAENIGKCVLAIIMLQVDFDFVDPKDKMEKPGNMFFHAEPQIMMHLKELASLTL